MVNPSRGLSYMEYIKSCTIKTEVVANYRNLLVPYGVEEIDRALLSNIPDDAHDEDEVTGDDDLDDDQDQDDDGDGQDRKPAAN